MYRKMQYEYDAGRAAAMTRPSSQPMNRSELYRWVMALGFCAYDMQGVDYNELMEQFMAK